MLIMTGESVRLMSILYIDCDSLRPDHLGCYGYHRETSPAIDRLAETGRRFTEYYAADVPCGPSRTGLLSGRFGYHTGVVNHGGINADARPEGPNRLAAKVGKYRSLPTVLQDSGMRTALISPFPARHGATHVLDGFTEWIDTGEGGNEHADRIYSAASDWLDRNATEEEWFLHVNFWDPHTHYDTPESFGNPFGDVDPPDWPRETDIQAHFDSYGPHSAQDVHHGYLYGDGPPEGLSRVPDTIESREDFTRWIDGYDVGIRYMDHYIGKLLERLEVLGVAEDTTIILSADHGENQGELNVYGDHQTADRATARIPLIVSGPDVEPGVDTQFHYALDLAPTLADLRGVDSPAGWDGQSFAGSLTEDKKTGRESLVITQGAWACQRGVRWDEWLLLRTYHDGFKDFAPVELYDIEADPHETADLAKERPSVVQKGLSILEAWLALRTKEAVTGTNGGNPEAPRGIIDPLKQVMAEGGPFYTRYALESYCERLRETDRNNAANRLERTEGFIEQSISTYLGS